MREFFYPLSVAVIGVSSKQTNLGRNIVGNLVEYGFNGIVYAVGPDGGMIETRRIYRSVGDIPDHVDLAVIFTPAKTVPGILDECGQKGIRRVIVETAGFREYGQEGRQLEFGDDKGSTKAWYSLCGTELCRRHQHGEWVLRAFPTLEKVYQSGRCLYHLTERGGWNERSELDGE